MTTSCYLRTVGLLLVAMVLYLSACKSGTSGDVGPQGPKGDVGAQGPKGDPGAATLANVIYSAWTTVPFSGTNSTYTGSLSATVITQDVLDKADIRVYWKDGDRVIPLPYAQTIGGTTYTVHQRFYLGRIELLANYMLSPQPMRYVIIPGTLAGGRQAAADLSDYGALKARYHLPD